MKTKFYFFCVTGTRSIHSHRSNKTYYKVESPALLSAWRKVREVMPMGNIYALAEDAEKRYKDQEFVRLTDDQQALS